MNANGFRIYRVRTMEKNPQWTHIFARQIKIREKINESSPPCKKCPYFEFFWFAFSGIRTYSVNLRIKFKYGKIRTRITQNTDTSHANIILIFPRFVLFQGYLGKIVRPIFFVWHKVKNLRSKYNHEWQIKCLINSKSEIKSDFVW